MIFTFNDYTLDVDLEKMQSIIPQKCKCECTVCTAFREYTATLNDDITCKLTALGVDVESPDEVFDTGEDENGNVCYRGWWNIYGKILTQSKTPCQLSDGFEVTFSDDSQYTPRWFQENNCFQMHFVISASHLKRLGKEYQTEISSTGAKKAVFLYHISDDACADMNGLVGGKIFKIYSDCFTSNGDQIKCHNAEFFIKSASGDQKLSICVSRDIDTCFDRIDRMVLTIGNSHVDSAEAELLPQDGILSCSAGRIKCIKIFESTIEGEHDKVVYDSHIIIEDGLGEKIIFRAEPDGEEMMTVFTSVDNIDVEKYLRVSDTWFVHPELIFDEKTS